MALTSLTNLQPLHVHSVGVSTFDGSVSVGGTLTYEDVTNVDAIGIITARSGVNVSGGQIDVGSNIKIGTAGVVTATSFVGSGANLTSLPAQATIANNADNRVITGGSGVNLNGEANLTFDGTNLKIGNAGTDGVLRIRGAANSTQVSISDNTSATLRIATASGALSQIFVEAGQSIVFGHGTNSGLSNERLRIASNGNVHIGSGDPTIAKLQVSGAGFFGSANTTKTNDGVIIERNSSDGLAHISAGRSGGNYSGMNFYVAGASGVTLRHLIDYQSNFRWYAANGSTERLRIDSDGRLLVNGASSTQAFSGGDDLIIGNTNSGTRSGITLVSNSSLDGGLYFSDGTSSGSAHVQGQIVYSHSEHYLRFYSSADEKFRIFGGTTDHVLQMRGGVQLSLSDFAPNQNFSGSYAGFHTDNHGNLLIGLNAHLDYGGGNSGVHKWKQTNAHSSIGSAGMFIGGNGSNNNSNICFFRNGQGSSAGASFAQDSWKFQISDKLTTNYNMHHRMQGYFQTHTSNQTASNCPTMAGTISYGYGYQEAYSTSGGQWLHPYPDLVLGYHTGTSFGSYRHYGGCRFFADHPSGNTSTILEVGNGGTGVHVTNSFTAGSNKGFRIAHPHPSKKYTHDLVHNAIEAPQMDLIYRGKVDLVGGSATVNIDTKAGMTDGTFVLLNRDIQCFTSNETGWTAVKGSVSGNILTITAQDNSCTDTISWMVVGERQDDKIKESELTTTDGDLIVEPLTIEATHM